MSTASTKSLEELYETQRHEATQGVEAVRILHFVQSGIHLAGSQLARVKRCELDT